MKLLSLDLTNFMNISQASVSFQDGLNILYGENAQGKSAVLSAIYYVLTDNKRGDSWKDFVKTGEDQFSIILTLQKSIHDPTIVTFEYIGNKVKGTTTKRIIDGSNPPVEGADECKALIQKWFDIQMIEAVIFSLQDSKPIGALSPSERAAIFKKLFNSDFSHIVEQILVKQKEFEDLIKLTQAETKTLQQQTYPLSRLAAIDEAEYVGLKKQRDLAIQVIQRYRTAEQQLESIKKTTDLLNALTQIKASQTGKYDAQLAAYSKEAQDTQAQITQAEANRLQASQLEQSRADELAVLLPPTEPETSPTLPTTIAELQLRIRAYMQGTCPTCGQVCDTTHSEELAQQLQEAMQQQQLEQQRRAQYQADFTEYTKQKQKLQSELNAAAQVKKGWDQRLQLFHASLAKFDIEAERARLQKLSEDESIKIDADIQSTALTLQSYPDEASVQSILDDIEIYVDAVRAEDSLRNKIETIDTLRIRNNQIAVENQKWLDKKAADEEQIKKNDDIVHEAQSKLSTLLVVKKIYQTEFPAYLNTRACSRLEAFMNRFLAATSNNMQVSLQQTKKGTEFYYKPIDSADWINAKMASGFESSALTIAFNAAVALAYKSSILVLDEVDKSASDSSSLKVADTISSISGFNQIFMITHKKATVELLRGSPATKVYHVQKGTFKPYQD